MFSEIVNGFIRKVSYSFGWSIDKISRSLIPLLAIILIFVMLDRGYKFVFADDQFSKDITHVDFSVEQESSMEFMIEGPYNGGNPVFVYVETSNDIESEIIVTVYSFAESENRFVSCVDVESIDDEKLESNRAKCERYEGSNRFPGHTLVGFVDVGTTDFLTINNSSPEEIKFIEGPQLSMPFLQDSFYEELFMKFGLSLTQYLFAFLILAVPGTIWGLIFENKGD
jgi:hypothetical protein